VSQVSKQPMKVSRESLSGKWKEGTVTWSATGGTANRSGPMALVGWQDNGIARAVWLVSATDFHGAVKVVKVVKVIEVLFERGIGSPGQIFNPRSLGQYLALWQALMFVWSLDLVGATKRRLGS